VGDCPASLDLADEPAATFNGQGRVSVKTVHERTSGLVFVRTHTFARRFFSLADHGANNVRGQYS
jgi:hypothetical protein